ncbi:MAG: group 1 truncated hemoglobin [Kofleriaceae bacterium]|nr:group 1 truncated hemoglobin [Kofleriaceae bacterium]
MSLLWAVVPVLIVGGCPSQNRQQGVGTSASTQQSLYVRLGGIESLRPLVDEWMLEVTSDKHIRDFFAQSDISKLKLRILEKICVLADGPCLYQGRGMYSVHAQIKLDDTHLQRFLVGLDAAMTRVSIEPAAAAELRERVRDVAAQIAVSSDS